MSDEPGRSLDAERERALVQRLATLVDNTPLAVVEWDADFRVTRWSGQAATVFGYTAAEVLGKPITDLSLVHPDDGPVVEQTMQRLLDPANPFVVSRNRNVRKDGSVVDCEWYNSTLHDGAGRMVAVLSLVLDVTERERAVARLRDADRRKDEFLATLAHELRNPLAPIRTGLEVLRLAAGDPERAERTRRMMQQQVGHMVRLIDDLLDVSRITSGRLQVRREPVDLAGIVRGVVEAFQTLVTESRQSLAAQLPATPVMVEADATRLAQVFSNLLGNAVKFSDRGGHLSVTLAADGPHAVVTVRDTGIGIPREHLAHVFEMFSQLEAPLSRTRGGLGIGLALARGLVELHGGTIEAHSEGPGRGTTFVVRLPRLDLGHEVASGEETAPAQGKARVLVVDDNRDAAESLAAVMELMGHEVRVAHDGEHALEVAATFRPRIVLLDLGMPRMNGYEAARAIRAEPWGRDVILIAVSGWAQEDDRRRTRDAGFDHHLAKPAELSEIQGLITRALATGR